jgi:hypothetical protein
MISNISRHAVLVCALAISTASFAASPAYLHDSRQLVRPESRTHRADICFRCNTRPPQMPLRHEEDPFADMLLG